MGTNQEQHRTRALLGHKLSITTACYTALKNLANSYY